MRSERDIFDDLARLVANPGYAHAIAYICYKDNFVRYSDEITPEDMLKMFSPERLIRNEITTLVGLLVKNSVDLSMPSKADFERFVTVTYQLLEELHYSVSHDLFESVRTPEGASVAFTRGSVMREPIFYSGESAFSFQYRDFAVPKYAADNRWLLDNKGFTIENAREVVLTIARLQNERVTDALRLALKQAPEDRTILPGFCFTAADVASRCDLPQDLILKIIEAFLWPEQGRNEQFESIHDFNAVRATPILKRNATEFLLFEQYSLVEALYDAPFYWMGADPKYASLALKNRGRFTESFSSGQLEKVFGATNVYSNVDIYSTKSTRIGEIDVLVLFADKAIVVQVKSKKLTLEARKGNDLKLRDDFKKSIQDSYDQARLCASVLRDPAFTLKTPDAKVIPTPARVRDVYIFCVIADHYPALAFQAEQFLNIEADSAIRPPMILDVFALDALCEMLDSPLHFFNYLVRRTESWERLAAPDEMTILSFHLKYNLWLQEEYDTVQLMDDFSADLEAAMTVRREGLPGKKTPDGILTRFEETTLFRLLEKIKRSKDPAALNLGIVILGMNQNSFERMNVGVETMIKQERLDGRSHDLSMGSTVASTGVTLHCNQLPIEETYSRLLGHCKKRKYQARACSWFGGCLNPYTAEFRCFVELRGEWKFDAVLEGPRQSSRKRSTAAGEVRIETRLSGGRNRPCPCGSGLKYKHCCLER